MDRSPRSSGARTRALVVARDPETREGWARSLEATGMDVMRCVGPAVSCPLVHDGARCPLLDDAELALYDEGTLTDEFIGRLRASSPKGMVVAARDRRLIGGEHEPALSRAIAP